MSAFDDTVPVLIDVGFRVAFFFSFLGRMVSLLGLRRRLPPSPLPEAPRSPVTAPRATWGTELTVSVSTVMFLTDPSPPDLAALFGFRLVKDLLAKTADGCFVVVMEGAFKWSLSSLLASPLIFPLLSLPLSAPPVLWDLVGDSSRGCSVIASGLDSPV